MATATARSPQANLQAMSDAPQSPLRCAHHTPTRTTTPRPSISPLSTASRPAKNSPIATRDALMADSDIHNDADPEATAADLADDMRDDGSSSLSEPDDDDEMEGMPQFTPSGHTGAGKLGTQKLTEVDSEAETERLEETPQKLRENADGTGKTPSKLRQAAIADDELSDPPSPLPAGVGVASSTSTIGTGGRPPPSTREVAHRVSQDDTSNARNVGQKRKRSDAEDSPLTSAESDIEESPRKRSHESPVDAPEEEEQALEVNGAEVQTAETEVRGTPSTQAGKGAKGRKGKQKGRKAKEQTEPLEPEATEEGAELEVEPSEETAQKTEEELKRKGEASTDFEDLVKQFSTFRERLVNERLAKIEEELQMLTQPVCEHPEYLRQIACIEERQAKQVREAQAYYYYRTQATRERILGDRAQLHSQYFQEVRELREDVLYKLGEDWYEIQKERRQQQQDGEERYLYMYKPKKSVQIKQQAKYNQEVSVLSGVAKYVGFPAAPEVGGVEGGGLDEDFKAMKVPRRVPHTVHHAHHYPQPQPASLAHQLLQQQRPQPVEHTPHPHNTVVQSASERRAHEQFLEQNAWARPQQSAMQAHGTPNLTHTADWVDQPGGSRNLLRNLSNTSQQYTQRTGSPFATPMSTKRPFNAPQSNGADDEAPSSALAAPHTDRQAHAQARSSGSPLMVTKQRAPAPTNTNGNGDAHHDGGREREYTGFRNISNMSGTSTIDAPLSAERPHPVPHSHSHEPHQNSHEHQNSTPGPLRSSEGGFTRPGLREEVSAPQQIFETSSLHRLNTSGEGEGAGQKDVYGGGQFRVGEGQYGTPAPLAGGRG